MRINVSIINLNLRQVFLLLYSLYEYIFYMDVYSVYLFFDCHESL